MVKESYYHYAVIRVVPRVDRDEFINAGVILYQRDSSFLGAKIVLKDYKLLAISPDARIPDIRKHLHAIERVCAGEAEAGPIAALSQAERFGWLTSPRNTMIQTSAVKAGIGASPEQELAELTMDWVS